MFRGREEGIQDNWDLWINVSVFVYDTTVSSSTGVTPHYAMFGREATLPVDWVFPTPSMEEKNNVSVDGRYAGRKTTCIQDHERSASWKSQAEGSNVQTFNPEHPNWVSSVVFQS